MIDYHEDAAFAAYRYREAQLTHEAEVERLVRATQASRPALHHQMLAKAGDWLIAAGTTLKAQALPPETANNW
jgi:hypothetical protein